MKSLRLNHILFAVAALFVLNGCASGRVRGERHSRTDRIPAKQSSYRVRGTDETGVLSTVQQTKLRTRTHSWRWPTNEVIVTSGFGSRGGEHHDGVDLRAKSGTAVHAAYDGKVIYAGSKIRGYGKMVVIKHDAKLSTIYAHNSRLEVKTGEKVRRGQLISYSGNTGHSSGPHLHFEVREGVTAVNPILLLPSPAVANEANRRMASEIQKTPARPVQKAKPTRTARYSQRYSQSSARVAARVAEDDGFKPKSPHAR